MAQGSPITVEVEGITLHLAHPDELPVRWVGQHETLKQLLAAWSVIDPEDLPMSPRLLGKPGVGKTTLAYAGGRAMKRDVYIYQATMDTRPEDLLITPVVDRQGSIRYVASSLVTARSVQTSSYVRSSPWTPTLRTGNRQTSACQMCG